jgi:hypothetical protein
MKVLVYVSRHINLFFHLNTVAKRCKRREHETRNKMSSEHRHMLQEEEKTCKEAKEEEGKDEERYDECEGGFPDSEYPEPPFVDNVAPDDISAGVSQSQSQQEPGYCKHCGESPCQFLEWQEELECIVAIMYPEVTNKQKR